MNNLPERFPEYAIMYKTLNKRIQQLEMQSRSAEPKQLTEIQKTIKRYQLEKLKIRKMFPENFFENS